ncbi:MAG TPA: zinc-ribbon domain-containing protein [Actinomycetes bacterium]
MGQRTCPNCGTTNAQNASTCSWCGRSLDDDATQPIGGPVTPPQDEQPTAAGWQRGDTAPDQPAGGSWDAAPTQQQPTGRSWEAEGSAQQSRGGAWEPPSPAQPAGGSWEASPTQQQPQGGAWEPPPSQPQGAPSWEPGEQRPAGGGWQQGGGSWEYGQGAQASGQQAGWGAQGGAAQPWGTPGPTSQGRRRPLLWVALGVVVLLVLVGIGIAAMNISGTVGKVARSNQPLQAPASIGGLARIDTGAIRSTLDQQSGQLRQKGAKNFVVAAYGNGGQPEFVVVAVREANDKTRQDITTGFDQALLRQGGAGTSQAQTYKQGSVEYRCTSSQLGATVAICRFNDGDVVGFGFSGTQNPQRVSQFTAEARDKMK